MEEVYNKIVLLKKENELLKKMVNRLIEEAQNGKTNKLD